MEPARRSLTRFSFSPVSTGLKVLCPLCYRLGWETQKKECVEEKDDTCHGKQNPETFTVKARRARELPAQGKWLSLSALNLDVSEEGSGLVRSESQFTDLSRGGRGG